MPGPFSAYEDLCSHNISDSQIFYYKPSGTYDVYIYYYNKFTTAPTTPITISSINCGYYRVTDNNTNFAWVAQYFSANKLNVQQYGLEVPDSGLGASNT